MSADHIDELVLGGACVVAFALYVAFILRPAWASYARVWQRLAAAVLSLYVLGVLVGVGVGGALAAVYYWG